MRCYIRSTRFLLIISVLVYMILSIPAQAATPKAAPRSAAFTRYMSAPRILGFGAKRGGLVPEPVDFSQMRHATSLTIAAPLPATYDLRTLGKLPAIKNQFDSGCCWAFASLGSLESYLLPGQTFDFSENNMKNLHGFDWDPNEGGGNRSIAAAYLARWSGPVSEEDDPYDPSSITSVHDLPIVQHVQDVIFLANRTNSLDNAEIKNAIMSYGAVFTSYYDEDAYFNYATNSYYYDGDEDTNHAVCLVGWDDNYDKNNFSTPAPGNGAFIVRNSWGAGWGDEGYYYISYYDSLVGHSSAVYQSEATNNYDTIFQYDTLGWTNGWGYGDPIAWFGNVFTSDVACAVSAVSFYTTEPASQYNVYVYVNPSGGPTNESGPSATKAGVMATAGYHTVKLTTPVTLSPGQRFSVVVKINSPGATYPIPIEERIPGYTSDATADIDQSYTSSNGTAWDDLTDDSPNSNVCVKAFANKVLTPTPHTGGPMIIHVKTDGEDTNDGSTWELAKKTVKAAIGYSQAGDEIWVAAGNYQEHGIIIKSGIALYGGFVGDETERDSRNWDANPTIIDANNNGTVVRFAEGVSSNTIIDGFVLTHGTGTDTAGWRQGGAIYCDSHASPTIANNLIKDNTADFGAGIFALNYSRPVIINNKITANIAKNHGGGIYCWFDPSVANFRPTEVTPYLDIEDNLITYNKAQWGSGIAAFGYAANVNADGTIVPGAYIVNNKIYFNGGDPTDTSTVGGGIYCEQLSPANIVANSIVQNTAGRGAGIHVSNSDATIVRNHIMGNTAVVGGGIDEYMSKAFIACNEIIGNIIGSPVATAYGSGIYLSGYSDTSIINNTIAGNQSPGRTGAIHFYDSSPMIQNNIIAYNTCGISGQFDYQNGGVLPSLAKNCLWNNTRGDYVGQIAHDTDVQKDPKLASIKYGNVHLQPGSPCVDAGNSSFVGANWSDVDGQNRVQGKAVDIGADESDGTLWQDAPEVIIYVKPGGNDDDPGTSWDTAKEHIQAAIDVAAFTGGDVWVAAGTYTLPLNDPIYGDKFKAMTLRSFVHLYGGFDGTEYERTARNWKDNPTIIAPETLYKPLQNGQTEADPTDESVRNTITVQKGPGLSTLDGFTITGAWSGGQGKPGGAVSCTLSSPFIRNNQFVNCKVQGIGGAIMCTSYSSPEITNNTFTGCGGKNCTQGGAIAATSYSNATISNCSFTNNKSGSMGGAVFVGTNSSVRINNNLFVGNRSGQGGGVASTGIQEVLGPWVTNNTFVSNIASNGGAVYISGALDAVVANDIMACNSTGLYVGSSHLVTKNNCLFENSTYNYSGTFPGLNDIEADPQFVDFAGGNYHIKSNSPCIDAGTLYSGDNKNPIVLAADRDIDLRSRVYGATVDIGVDEWRGLYNESLTPNSGPLPTSKPRVLTTVYAHPDGYDSIENCYMLINTSLSGARAVYLYFDPQANKLYVRKDDNTGWVGGFAPGSNNIIENSQVALNCATTTISHDGENLSIAWNVTIKDTMVNKKCNAYMLVDDVHGLRDGWDMVGSFVLSAPPTNVSISPNSGSLPVGKQISLTSKYGDDDGFMNCFENYLLINSTLSFQNAPYVRYNRQTNKLYVRNDADTAWIGGYAPGSSYTIENSYVRLYCQGTKISGAGSIQTIVWSILIKQPLPGEVNAYMKVQDNTGLIGDWTKTGTFGFSNPPVNISLTPNKGTLIVDRLTTFSSKYSDPDQATDLSTCYYLMNTGVTGLNGIYAKYDAVANKLYLRNSANTDWGTGVTPGTAVVLENSSCKLDCSQTTVSKVGVTMTINWKIRVKSYMLGKTLNAYQLVVDKAGQKTDYDKMGQFGLSLL